MSTDERNSGTNAETGATPMSDETAPQNRPGDDETATPLTDELRAVRPDETGLTRSAVRNKIGAALFGRVAEPTKLGRFVLLDRLGQGGMGTVYSAYDPKLDRRVALKLLRAESSGDPAQLRTAQARLEREAQALAKLSHPNVVPVHDVGVIESRVFVVMEFVIGQTLDSWRDHAPRSVRDILAIYQQAGRGLAAAHAAGLIHRDFKPSNAIVGRDDGRVRVLDFGLARGHSATTTGEQPSVGQRATTADDAPPGRAPRPRNGSTSGDQDTVRAPDSDNSPFTALTRTGAVMGTPAYMSPEQFAGAQAGPASDQFSFCAALFEALYGRRPFTGRTPHEIGHAVIAGEICPRPSDPDIPAWLYPVICRGLQPSAADRYPSMDALLEALARDPIRRRKRIAAIAAAAALATALTATSAYGLLYPAEAIEPCQGAERAIAAVWTPERRAAIEAAMLATGHPYAATALPRVLSDLDGYAHDWAEMHRDACLAHRHGEQSSVMLDRRMMCLGERRENFSAALDALATTSAAHIADTELVVAKLPRIDRCADTESLAAAIAPPDDPAVATQVDALRLELSRVRALEAAARYPEALAQTQSLRERSEGLGYVPLEAELELVAGRLAMSTSSMKQAIEPLRAAMLAGMSRGMDELSVEALARLIYAEAVTDTADAAADSYLSIGRALIDQVPAPAFVHALLLNNGAGLHVTRGEREAARELFQQALAARARGPEGDHPELWIIELNLALITDDPAERDAMLDRAHARQTQRVSDEHPLALRLRLFQGALNLDLHAARATLEPVCSAYQRFHPEILDEHTNCRWELAMIEADLGRLSAAADQLSHVSETLTAADQHPTWRRRAEGYAMLFSGRYQAARAEFQAALEESPAAPDESWWQAEIHGELALGLGLAAHASGDREAAVRALELALPTFERALKFNQSSWRQRRLRWAKLALATVLWDKGTTQATRDRARALIDEVDAWYRAHGDSYQARRQQVADWRAAHSGGE